MVLTHESTTKMEPHIDRLPPWVQLALYERDDELQALRQAKTRQASTDDEKTKLAAKVERAAKAREARTERLRAVMARAVDDHRAALVARPRGRTGWLQRQMEFKRARNIPGYELVPCYETLLKYLKSVGL